MEKAHWLARKRAALLSAQVAVTSKARLAHYELAGRYRAAGTKVERFAQRLAHNLQGGADDGVVAATQLVQILQRSPVDGLGSGPQLAAQIQAAMQAAAANPEAVAQAEQAARRAVDQHGVIRNYTLLQEPLLTNVVGTVVVTFNHIPMASTMETFGGYTDAPPAPTLITVSGKVLFRHVVSNAAEVLAALGHVVVVVDADGPDVAGVFDAATDSAPIDA